MIDTITNNGYCAPARIVVLLQDENKVLQLCYYLNYRLVSAP